MIINKSGMSVVVLKTRETVKERPKDAKESELLCDGGDEMEVQIWMGGKHDAYLCWIRSLRVHISWWLRIYITSLTRCFSPASDHILAMHIHRVENSSAISSTVDTV